MSDQPQVDGISAVQPSEPVSQAVEKQEVHSQSSTTHVDKQAMRRAKFMVLVILAIPYAIYIAWCLFLLAVLPDRTGNWDYLIPTGRLSSMVAAVILFLIIVWAGNRIIKVKNTDKNVRIFGLVRVVLFAIPGLLLSGVIPFVIAGEPGLRLQITEPVSDDQYVAPLIIEYSVQEAFDILKRRGLTVSTVSWDFQSDGVVDDETLLPMASALYERQGVYNVSARLRLSDNTTRTLRQRISIPRAVFSYKPVEPIVDESVLLSIDHLLDETDVVREVRWDFNSDGIADETTQDTSISHTFLSTGSHEVTATIQFENQTQQKYTRVLTISEPKPLPFPVTIETVPTFLESPPPFQVIFTVVTDEQVRDIVWDFGDGTEGEGARVGHTFTKRGVFQVTAEVRSQNGQIARVSRVVKLANTLNIPDLTFDGTHDVQNAKITVEAPVTITLSPKTGLALVDFFWEAPKASGVQFDGSTVTATYRDSGVYTLLLIGKDPEGSVLRYPITVNVTPVQSSVAFDMNPDQGVAPLEVEFDASESRVPGEVITGFVWNFGDGRDSSERLGSAKVSHTFAQAGTYQVQLTVYTTTGKEFTAQKTIVVRAPFLDACFLMSRQEGAAPLGVRFDRSCSTGNFVSVLWDFGDGSQSDDMNATVDHVFEVPNRSYNVTLTLTDANGNISTFTNVITTQ